MLKEKMAIITKTSQAATYSRSLYDAFYLYALGLNRTLAVDPVNGLNNSALLKRSLTGTFYGKVYLFYICILRFDSGMTGDVTININSSRAPLFSVVALNSSGVTAGYFNITVDATIMSKSVGCIGCAVSM